MNPNVTFFYNQNESGGSAWRTTVNVSNYDQTSTGSEPLRISLYVYTGNGQGASALRGIDSGKVFAVDEYHKFLNKIRAQIQTGLILEESVGASGSRFRWSFASSKTPRPRSVLQLRPGYPATFVPFEKEGEISLGEHLIVPVDVPAEEQLEVFLAQLKWFSPDIESLVLNTIWRPGLERRIARVEKRLGIPEDVAHLDSTSGLKKWWSRGFRYCKVALDVTLRYSPVLTMILLLVLLLGKTQISWSADRLNEPQNPPGVTNHPAAGGGEEDMEAAAGAQGGPFIDQKEPAKPEEEVIPRGPKAEMGAQLSLLDDTFSGLLKRTPESILYASHFTDRPVRSLDDLIDNQAFAWGFVKLIYLRTKGTTDLQLGQSKGDIMRVIESSNQRSWTRVALEQMLPGISEREKSAVALVTCRAFRRTQGGLPGDPRPENDRDWRYQSVDMEQDCQFDDTELRLAADALQALNDHLATIPKEQGN